MIIPNIENEENYSFLSTAFQWKFSVNQVRSGVVSNSPPFYNAFNAYCFQLQIKFEQEEEEEEFEVCLHRYRGIYDHNENEISERIFFNFEIRIFGKCGEQKQLKWEDDEYIIPRCNNVSNFGLSFTIDNR